MERDIRLIPLVGGAEIRIRFDLYNDALKFKETLEKWTTL